jgi:glycosyltransferase involved in cell wall biosynthesis
MRGPRLAWTLLRSEGGRSVLARLADRNADVRRARGFATRQPSDPPFGAPILHLLPTPLATRIGGLQAQLARRLEAGAERGPNALLAPSRRGFRLELAGPGRREVSLFPAGATSLASPPVLAAARQAAGANALQIEGLAGWSLAEITALSALATPLVVALHDFAAFCRRPHLLEQSEPERFCDYSRNEARCLACLQRDWPETPSNFQREWRAATAALLGRAAAVVYPSEFLRRQHGELFASLPVARQFVIAPASTVSPLDVSPPQGPVRHVAWVGSVRVDKGALVFEAAVKRLAAQASPLRFSVFGGGDPDLLTRLRRLPNVRVRGYYRQGKLAEQLAAARVDLALLLSIVPESYGLTLDECSAAGVPALAFARGALAERIPASGAGALLATGGDPATELCGQLAALARGETALPRITAWTGTTPAAAAARWEALYRELGLDPGAAATVG